MRNTRIKKNTTNTVLRKTKKNGKRKKLKLSKTLNKRLKVFEKNW